MGILSELSTLLADEGIGLFAISAFDTYCILTKACDHGSAMDILEGAGHEALR